MNKIRCFANFKLKLGIHFNRVEYLFVSIEYGVSNAQIMAIILIKDEDFN